jgi:Leucine-rich repeat (LRR) protein
MSDDSCMKMSEEGAFADITVLGNGLKQISWTDMNNELGVKGIPCGFNADIIELELDGKLRTMEFSNENSTLTWMPPMLDDLQYLREFHFNDQSQFENFEPTFFNKLGRPKKMESISITGVNADLDFQWPSTFFGMPESDGFGQFVSLDISDNSAFTKFKEEWLYQFVSMQGLYLSDNPALSDIPANLITRWDASLENFDISGNAIAEWPTNEEGDAVAFLDMENSMHIDISDNEFTSVPGSVFEDIQSINDGAGWSVDMGGNPCTPVDNPCTDVNTCACN